MVLQYRVCVATVALLAVMAATAAAQPMHQSSASSPDDVVTDPLQYLLVQRLLNARLAEGARPISPESALVRDLALLAHAAAAGVAYHTLPVPAASIRSYCQGDNNRQCREACFHLGDSACIDGNIAGNGNDNAFLEGGFHPGK